jgi:alanine dehydrogenase
MSRLLVIRSEEYAPHLAVRDCIPAVEAAFRSLVEGRAEHPAKYHDRCPWGLWFYMGGNVFDQEAMAIKLGCAAAAGGSCQVIYYDSTTAEPKALLEGLRVTHLRTGAAAAIGARWLARPESRTVAVLGAGRVCWSSLEGLSALFALERVLVADIDPEATTRFVERARATYGFQVAGVTPEEAVRQADIVVSATPARAPLVASSWVRPGTHFSAMGADGAGKQELDSDLHRTARVFCDSLDQCLKWGDINNTVKAGGLNRDDLAGELGAVIAGNVPGRLSADDITLFDATGLGIQDAVVARLIFDTAVRCGLGTWVEL